MEDGNESSPACFKGMHSGPDLEISLVSEREVESGFFFNNHLSGGHKFLIISMTNNTS